MYMCLIILLLHYNSLIDRPADCSGVSVALKCHAIPSAEDDVKIDISVTLSASDDLMCVVGYLIQFNGENKTVSLDSPSANFTVSVEEGQPLPNDIVVYTLDYENRTGQIPCNSKIVGELVYIKGVRDDRRNCLDQFADYV